VSELPRRRASWSTLNGRKISYAQLGETCVSLRRSLKRPSRSQGARTWAHRARLPRLTFLESESQQIRHRRATARYVARLVARAPCKAKAPVSIDDKAAKAVPGRCRRAPALRVGVIAQTSWGARQARRCTEGDMDHECPARQLRQRSDPRGVSGDRQTIHTKAVSISRDAPTWVWSKTRHQVIMELTQSITSITRRWRP